MFEGRITLAQAESEATTGTWSDVRDPQLENVFHLLMHYVVDEDIRQKDPDYADAQTSGLKNAAEKLKG